MNSHYDEDALLEYVEGHSTIGSEIELHALSCTQCAAEIEQQRRMIAALRQDEPWQPPQVLAEVAAGRLADVVSFKERLDAEDAGASARLKHLLNGPSAWWRNAMRKEPGVRTAGMVRQLLGRMRELLERVPADALIATTLATEIAEGLSVAQYPSDFVVGLRGQALRDHAFVLSFMGRYPDARVAADRAERLFKQTPVPDYELARLDLVRANILRGIERYEESIQLADRAADTFARFGDRQASVNARMYQAANLFQQRQYAQALAIWKVIENDVDGDDARVMVLHNLGICYRETGKLEAAAEYLSRAAAEFEILGREANRAKSRWALASTLMAAEKHESAIRLLREVWRDFESYEMEADAALAALELAESLLVVNRPDEVPAICRALLDRFTRLGMSERAIVALAFLRESVATGHATPVHVRHVHDFLRDLPAEGERFSAPPPLGSLD
jgi:tetratricopeptide (TPR) repeat protein